MGDPFAEPADGGLDPAGGGFQSLDGLAETLDVGGKATQVVALVVSAGGPGVRVRE
jgi:hypothetical protein